MELARPDDVYPRGDSSRGATVIWSGGEYVWRERERQSHEEKEEEEEKDKSRESRASRGGGEQAEKGAKKKKRRRGGSPKKKEEYRERRTGSSGTKGGRRKVRELVGGTEIGGGEGLVGKGEEERIKRYLKICAWWLAWCICRLSGWLGFVFLTR